MKETAKLYWQFAASCCLVLFVILGYIVKFYEQTVLWLDVPILSLVRQHLTSGKTAFWLGLTQFGSGKRIALLVCLMLVLLISKKYYLDALWLVINTALIAGVGNYLIKFVFVRPRPDLVQLTRETHYSFPSGHAMGSMLMYGTLIILLPRLVQHPTARLILQLALGGFILLIGFSRLYLGVHYPSDIIGGYLLGAAWLCGSYPLFDKQRFIWRFQGKQR